MDAKPFCFINLTTTDPRFNLAAEEYVFDCLDKSRSYFMLWQNDNAVIIGKYQNALSEVNLENAEKNGTRIVRRLSGGGAVYHDMGNINFTFITDAPDAENLNMKLFCEPIAELLNELGCNASVTGRNDMTIDGKKFSGNSQYVKGGRVMHHGTLMFDSDLEKVTGLLNVDPSKFEGKGIRSVRSRVTNIRPHLKHDMTLDEFKNLLAEKIVSASGGYEYSLTEEDFEKINKISAERYSLWEWNIGSSPKCTIKKEARFEGVGKIEAYISVEDGIVTSITFRGDYFSAEDPEILARLLTGARADYDGYSEAIGDTDVSGFFRNMDKSSLLSLLLN